MSKKEKKNYFWYIFFSVLLSWIALSAFIIHDGRNKFSTAAKSHPEGVFFRSKLHDFTSKGNEMLPFF